MCFRPNETHNSNDILVKGACPNCGHEIDHYEGIIEGECPYCSMWIPAETLTGGGVINPGDNARIL